MGIGLPPARQACRSGVHEHHCVVGAPRVGHHALKHPATSVDNETSRKDELAADKWAFARMTELGYALFPVGGYLDGPSADRLLSGGARSGHGRTGEHAPVMAQSRWRDAGGVRCGRRSRPDSASVRHRHPATAAADATFALADLAAGEFESAVVENGRLVLGVTEASGNSIATVYMRDPTGTRVEFTFPDVTRALLFVRRRVYDAGNRLIASDDINGVQESTAAFDFIDVGGVKVFQVIRENVPAPT